MPDSFYYFCLNFLWIFYFCHIFFSEMAGLTGVGFRERIGTQIGMDSVEFQQHRILHSIS